MASLDTISLAMDVLWTVIYRIGWVNYPVSLRCSGFRCVCVHENSDYIDCLSVVLCVTSVEIGWEIRSENLLWLLWFFSRTSVTWLTQSIWYVVVTCSFLSVQIYFSLDIFYLLDCDAALHLNDVEFTANVFWLLVYCLTVYSIILIILHNSLC